MTSAPLILYLGCWLAVQSGVWGALAGSLLANRLPTTALPAPRPSISVSPSGVIAPGTAVTIRCRCQCGARRILLYKNETEIQEWDAGEDRGEFTIPSAGQEDSGVYICRTSCRSKPPVWSYSSDFVWIIVGETYYPKPNISLSPSGEVTLGGAVTVWCWGQYKYVRFLLYKDGNLTALQDTEPAGVLVEFPIRSLSWRDTGNYSCYYHRQGHDFTFSHPSDPVELVVPEETDPAGPQQPDPPTTEPAGEDYTRGNIVRLALSAGALLALALILAEAAHGWRTGGR